MLKDYGGVVEIEFDVIDPILSVISGHTKGRKMIDREYLEGFDGSISGDEIID